MIGICVRMAVTWLAVAIWAWAFWNDWRVACWALSAALLIAWAAKHRRLYPPHGAARP